MNRAYPPNLSDKFPQVVFTLADAIYEGITRHFLLRLEKDGYVEKISRGVYRLADSDISEEESFKAATLRVGQPSAVCLVSALAHYSLTDTIPSKTWIMVPAAKRSRCPDLRIIRSRRPHWEIGISKKNGYAITNIERTVVDSLVLRTKFGSQLGVEALRRALKQRKTSLSKVVDMARRLGILHRITAYIEALTIDRS